METKPNLIAKEHVLNQSGRSDSGIFSATANSTFPEEEHMESSAQASAHTSDTDNRSDCSSPDQKFFCPICKTMLTSQHDFTLHIRSHNNDDEVHDDDKGFVCRICKKSLSSSSSLDRHVLVHSGERPFSCKYCGDTFTTNGNMHRHVRTHSSKNDNYESDGSTDSSGSRKIEYNNNKVDGKRKTDDAEDLSNKVRVPYFPFRTQEAQHYKCPVCERTDFSSLKALETHFQDNHPDYPVTCHECNVLFQNSKLLGHHKSAVHCSEDNGKIPKSCVTGFKDLTFVDFSSEKFPHIARYQCEKSLHKVSGGLKFQCQKCSHAFPCSASLEIHERNCSVGLDLSVKGESANNEKLSQTEIKKVDFFGRLDLQNSSPEKHAPEETTKLQQRLLESAVKKTIDTSRDLADIQSIISMTSNGSLLQQLCQKQVENIPPRLPEPNPDLNRSEQEEESQDVFATEFRKMKLKGEFPCRLCTAVFPNLRALKGHNRTHLNGMNNGTYRCNMCPHSSVDKAALIRHMRTHNGDRPYECSLCNYAFTTKANCERHLRNRHGKNTREEVKKSIIYHPSEDPTNDELNKLSLRDEKKQSVQFPADNGVLSPEKMRSSTPKLLHANIPETVNALAADIRNSPRLSLSSPKSKEPLKPYSNISELIHSENIKSLKDHRLMNMEQMYLPRQYGFGSKEDVAPPPGKIHVKSLDSLTKTPSFESSGDEAPQHSSTPDVDGVLDLSKKKKDDNDELDQTDEDVPQDLSKKSPSVHLNMGEILAQQLLKHTPHKIDPHSLYATQLALFRNGLSLPNWPPFSINPLLFQTLNSPLLTQDPQELKEKLQRIQQCGGNIVTDSFMDRLKNFHSLNSTNISAFSETKNDYVEKPYVQEELKPLTLNVDQSFCDGMSKVSSPLSQTKSDMLQSPNSVKMVIKNGVLMPKQKQRRYRTERPFSCEHCAARFTLRSNMERHIKQQHPQFWSQRQRAGLSSSGRKTQTITTNVKTFCDINIPSYEVPKMHGFDQTKDHIDEKIKYAILAHRLRNSQNSNPNYPQQNVTKKEEDEDCDLIIDENDDAKTEVKTDITEKDEAYPTPNVLEEKMKQLHARLESKVTKMEEAQDLVPVSRLLDNASQQQFKEYFRRDGEEPEADGISEEDEEGLVASGSTSEGNNSGTDENR